MKTLLKILITIFTFSGSVVAQSTFDIRLNLSEVDCDAYTACYDVQLKTSDMSDWGLAGQNYRIYYDNSKADYTSGTKVLDGSYGSFSLVQDIGPVDASASSSILGFEETLGFLNYSIDLNNLSTGGIDVSGTWTTTSNICFSINSSVIDDHTECVNIVWARDGLTNNIATAFVEVSEWVSANTTTDATGQSYIDMDSGDHACFNTSCASGPPCSTDGSVAVKMEGNGSQGVLLPIVSEQQRLAITCPDTGLLLFQNDEAIGFYYYNGTQWKKLADI